MEEPQLHDELVVDPNEVFPDLGEHLPVQNLDGDVGGDQRQRHRGRSVTPDPAMDVGGEGDGGVDPGVDVHSNADESDGDRNGDFLNELPDPPLDDLVPDDQALQNALNQTAFQNRTLRREREQVNSDRQSNMADSSSRVVVTPQVCGVMSPLQTLSSAAQADSSSSSSSEEEQKKMKRNRRRR